MALVDAALIKSLALKDAIVSEVGAPLFLLPNRNVETALVGAADYWLDAEAEAVLDRLASYFGGRFQRGHERHSVEVVLAQKSQKGRRPLHVMSFEQRVLYRALVESLEPDVPKADRSDEAWTAFQEGPLADEGYQYLVRTDVVGFYQYVDHELLLDELVARTGNARTAEAIGELLTSVTGRAGLPQNVGASHVLSEYYLDAVERALLRNGHPMWRFSDDIIVASNSWVGINHALGELSERLRRVGLVINEEKTRYFRQDTYRRWIADPLERLREAGGADLVAVVDDYDPDEPPDDEDRQLDLAASEEVAVELLERSLAAHRSSTHTDRLDAVVNRKVLRGALRLLTLTESAAGLGHVPDLLRYEPQLTASVSKYLKRVASNGGADSVRGVLSTCVDADDLYISPWQAAWLIDALQRSEDPFDEPLQGWLRTQLLSTASTTRSQAAEVLAYPDQIDVTELTRLYEMAPPASKVDFAAAIFLRCWDRDAPPVKSVRRDSPLNDVVADAMLPR